MDLLKAMTVFVRVVDTGSLTAAASECGMSATMVGNYIQALEKRLGNSLLHRTTRRQTLSEFGKLYYEQCQTILGHVADADALALEAQGVPRGRLRVTAPITFATQRLMPALADYLAKYPEVEVDVMVTDKVVDLVEEGFEAAIRLGSLPDARLIARPLAPYKMMMAAAPSYLARRGEPKTADDLTGHDCLCFSYSPRSEWHSARQEWKMSGPDGETTVNVTGVIHADSALALRSAALAGVGIVMLPEILLEEDVVAGRLVSLLDEYEFPSRPVHVLYLRDRRISPKLRSFVDFIIARFG